MSAAKRRLSGPARTLMTSFIRGTMGVNSLPKTVTRQRCDCDLNPGPSAPEYSMLTTRLPSQPCVAAVSSNHNYRPPWSGRRDIRYRCPCERRRVRLHSCLAAFTQSTTWCDIARIHHQQKNNYEQVCIDPRWITRKRLGHSCWPLERHTQV